MNDVKSGTPRTVTMWMVVLFVLPFVIYGQAMSFDFVNAGDDVYVYENASVLGGVSVESVRWAFTTAYFGNYHPLTWIDHMLDVQWIGLAPGRHHAVNVLLHAMNGVLLFLLLRGWTGAIGRSAVVALLFAVHPLHVESVVWVSQRKEVLSTFFLLLGLGVYTQYVRGATWRRYLTLSLVFAAASLANPALIIFPALLLLLDYWPLNRFGKEGGVRRLVSEKSPLIAMAGTLAIITYVVMQQSNASLWGIPYATGVRITSAIETYAVYLGQTIWPANLVPFYPRAGTMPLWFSLGIAGAIIVSVTVVAIRSRATYPFILVGWGWYLISLFPNIGIVDAELSARADRYTYVPLIGIFIIGVWGVAAIAERRKIRDRIVVGFAVTTVGLFALMAYVQAGHWRNSESLWRYTVKVSPQNAFAFQNLGTLYLASGNLDESEAALLQALEHSDGDRHTHVALGGRALTSLGAVANLRGDFRQSAKYYARATELLPGDARVHSNYGEALLASEQSDAAIAELRRAVELDPQLAAAWNSLAFALILQRNIEEALDAGSHAIALDSRNPEYRYHMALAEFVAERFDPALKHLEEVFANDDQFAQAIALRTEILARRGIAPQNIGDPPIP